MDPTTPVQYEQSFDAEPMVVFNVFYENDSQPVTSDVNLHNLSHGQYGNYMPYSQPALTYGVLNTSASTSLPYNYTEEELSSHLGVSAEEKHEESIEFGSSETVIVDNQHTPCPVLPDPIAVVPLKPANKPAKRRRKVNTAFNDLQSARQPVKSLEFGSSEMFTVDNQHSHCPILPDPIAVVPLKPANKPAKRRKKVNTAINDQQSARQPIDVAISPELNFSAQYNLPETPPVHQGKPGNQTFRKSTDVAKSDKVSCTAKQKIPEPTHHVKQRVAVSSYPQINLEHNLSGTSTPQTNPKVSILIANSTSAGLIKWCEEAGGKSNKASKICGQKKVNNKTVKKLKNGETETNTDSESEASIEDTTGSRSVLADRVSYTSKMKPVKVTAVNNSKDINLSPFSCPHCVSFFLTSTLLQDHLSRCWMKRNSIQRKPMIPPKNPPMSTFDNTVLTRRVGFKIVPPNMLMNDNLSRGIDKGDKAEVTPVKSKPIKKYVSAVKKANTIESVMMKPAVKKLKFSDFKRMHSVRVLLKDVMAELGMKSTDDVVSVSSMEDNKLIDKRVVSSPNKNKQNFPKLLHHESSTEVSGALFKKVNPSQVLRNVRKRLHATLKHRKNAQVDEKTSSTEYSSAGITNDRVVVLSDNDSDDLMIQPDDKVGGATDGQMGRATDGQVGGATDDISGSNTTKFSYNSGNQGHIDLIVSPKAGSEKIKRSRQKTASSATVFPYSCLQCSASFMLHTLLLDHEKIHSGSKPFSCTKCPKNFTTRKEWRAHQAVHYD